MLNSELLIVREKMNAAAAAKPVQRLLASVAQNPSSETFLISESQLSVSKEADLLQLDNQQVEEPLRKASDLIHAVLLHLQSLFCVPGLFSSEVDKEICDRRLFENLTRLKKMLIVAKVLSYRRLASFKNEDGTHVTPDVCDTPSQIMELWAICEEFENERQQARRQEYEKMLAKRVSFDFLALGYGIDQETPRKKARKFLEGVATRDAKLQNVETQK